MINLIWAMDENNLIGQDDKLPWHIKEDLLYYKEKTKGQTVLMGDVTYYSLKGYYKNRPLPYGKIYVATLQTDLVIEEGTIINDLISFLINIKEDIFVVGGRTIYKLSLPYANRLYISRVHGNHVGNVYFPEFDLDEYKLISERKSTEVDYLIYERK